MTFEVRVSGTAPAAAAADHSDTAVDDSAKLDPNATPPAAWQAYDPTLACTPCSPSPPSWPAASPSSCRRAAPRPRSATCGRCSAPSPWVPPCSGWPSPAGGRSPSSAKGGIERWIVYPIVPWLVAFGSWLMAAPPRITQRASD